MAQQRIRFKVTGDGAWKTMTAKRPGNWTIMTIPERTEWARGIIKSVYPNAYDIRGCS